MTVGEKIKMLRQRCDLSQAQLAEALCVSRAAIAKWENDNGLPEISNLKALAEYMQVDLDALLDETNALDVPASIQEPPESICGNRCSQCDYRDKFECKGCRQGPGKKYSGSCQVAWCCHNAKLSSCAECTARTGCSKLKNEPLKMKMKMDAALDREELIRKRSRPLGKWLWISFWLVIATLLGDILSLELLAERFHWLCIPGRILMIAGKLSTILILFHLSSLTEFFPKAGRWLLVGTVLQLFTMIFAGDGENVIWSFLNLGGNFIILVGHYHKFCAYTKVLHKIDDEMSESWTLFRKWYCWIHGAFWASILLLLIGIPLALLTLFVSAVAMLIITIVEPVKLYHTAKLFRSLMQENKM